MTVTAVGFRSARGPILIAAMLATGLGAIDSTILATAVPTIVQDLGGFESFPWLFSVYLLAQAVTVPIYAKLADTFGRKPIVLVGIGIFLLGSLLCGFAWSMVSLIVFRAIQGLGAGAIMPVTMTIIGDIYTLEERARVQGYVASVWGIASVVGPTLGGLFSQFASWEWIFFVNVPLCLLAAGLFWRGFREQVERRPHRIDFAGAAVFAVALALILLGVLQGGVQWAWDSAQSIGVFAAGGLLGVVFVLIERRAAEPVLPLWILTRRLVLATCLVTTVIGIVLVGLTSFVPVYLENSLEVPPIVAGLTVALLTLGWPIATSFAGRIYLRIGFRSTMTIGAGIAIVATAVLAIFAATPNIVIVGAACFVTGLGMGLLASPGLIAAQMSVPWSERGVVTGANMFARTVGSAVGVAVLGSIANALVAANGGDDSRPETITAAGIGVFLAIAVATVVAIVFARLLPRDVREHGEVAEDVGPASEPGAATA